MKTNRKRQRQKTQESEIILRPLSTGQVFLELKKVGIDIDLVKQIEKILSENDRLRTALFFYAKEDNWDEVEGTDGYYMEIRNDSSGPKHNCYGGKTAREALSVEDKDMFSIKNNLNNNKKKEKEFKPIKPNLWSPLSKEEKNVLKL